MTNGSRHIPIDWIVETPAVDPIDAAESNLAAEIVVVERIAGFPKHSVNLIQRELT